MKSRFDRNQTEVGFESHRKLVLQHKADAPLRPAKPQEACDVGLFSDQASQLDLVTLANTARVAAPALATPGPVARAHPTTAR